MKEKPKTNVTKKNTIEGKKQTKKSPIKQKTPTY